MIEDSLVGLRAAKVPAPPLKSLAKKLVKRAGQKSWSKELVKRLVTRLVNARR